MCDSDSGLSLSMNGSQLGAPYQSTIFIRITNGELQLDKILNFPPSTKIFDIKLAAIGFITIEIKDKWNFGLFLPPSRGKAGKFLQEDRSLNEYPFDNSVGHLELKYKQRVYRLLKANSNKLKKLHVRQNLKHFIDSVKSADIEKVNKWLNRGLDPNFQSRENGDTPLTVAVKLENPREMIMALVAGGAHLDYRAADTMTPLHRAAAIGNHEAIRVLLDLGQSPNTRDQFHLTPLYYAVLNNTSGACVESLLFERATLGTTDDAGLQEIHQACRFGRVQHLDLLIFYGADVNSQTSKNQNTPLHICAFTGQESCARMLLFRGAERTLVNRAGHTAHQQAVLSNHHEVAELIRNFQDKDVVPLRDRPKMNNRRRSSSINQGSQNRCSSLGRLNERASPDDVFFDRSPDIICSPPSVDESSARSRPGLFMNDFTSTSASHYCLDSAMARYAHSKTTAVTQNGTPLSLSRSTQQLNKDVFQSPEPETFPNYAATMKLGAKGKRTPSNSVTSPRGMFSRNTEPSPLDAIWMQGHEGVSDTASIFSTASSLRGNLQSAGLLSSASTLQMLLSRDASILDLDTSSLPRMVVLQKGPHGYGFVVRGRRGVPGEFTPTLDAPALQYLEKIEPRSAAELAGLQTGDYILEVNGTNVSTMPHEAVVQLIRNSGDVLALKVITVDSERLHDCSTLESQSIKETNGNDYLDGKIYQSVFIRNRGDTPADDQTVKSPPITPRRPVNKVNNIQSLNASTTVQSARDLPNQNSSEQTQISSNPQLSAVLNKWRSFEEAAQKVNSTAASKITSPTGPPSLKSAGITVTQIFSTSKESVDNIPPPPPIPRPNGASNQQKPIPNGIDLTSSSSNRNAITHLPPSKARQFTSLSIDDQLPLPPPPEELNAIKVNQNTQPPNLFSQPNGTRNDTQENESAPINFTDHLKKAIELRRQKLDLQSNEDADDPCPILDTKPSITSSSTLYTKTGDQTVCAKGNSVSFDRSISLSQTGEASFKIAAEKFHKKALERISTISNPTIPPPEKFKDETVYGKTNSSVSVQSTINSNNCKRNGELNGFIKENRPTVAKSPIPPPPPIFISKPPVKFKSGL